jgi:hypothetical protein
MLPCHPGFTRLCLKKTPVRQAFLAANSCVPSEGSSGQGPYLGSLPARIVRGGSGSQREEAEQHGDVSCAARSVRSGRRSSGLVRRTLPLCTSRVLPACPRRNVRLQSKGPQMLSTTRQLVCGKCGEKAGGTGSAIQQRVIYQLTGHFPRSSGLSLSKRY